MLKFCPFGTKNKRKKFVRMKKSNFILHGRKPKFAIKVGLKIYFSLKKFY
jgi:hypothetical protein